MNAQAGAESAASPQAPEPSRPAARDARAPSVLIVCEHASMRFGGEAILPLHYFMHLSRRFPAVYLLTHERVRPEIEAIPGIARDRVFYLPDTRLHVWLHRLGSKLPPRIAEVTTGVLMHAITQVYQHRIARRLVRERGIQVVHEPAPVSPRQPSMMFGLGAPVVIGPMNGGMDFPPAFSGLAAPGEALLYRLGRIASTAANLLIPGKLHARMLLVANERTRRALPPLRRGEVRMLVENGVVADAIGSGHASRDGHAGVHLLFVGRLVDWKAVDIIIDALGLCAHPGVRLDIVGDGPERSALEARAASHPAGTIEFHGRVPFTQVARYYDDADIFLLPSVRECGGAVVLEAMARGLPVIATAWGGPTDYVTSRTGTLIPPGDRMQMVRDFAREIDRLASAPGQRQQLGAAAIDRVRTHFSWDAKIDQIRMIYDEALST